MGEGVRRRAHEWDDHDHRAVHEVVDEEQQRVRRLLDKSVEDLELSVRSSNCLRAAEIKSIGGLVQKTSAAREMGVDGRGDYLVQSEFPRPRVSRSRMPQP